MTISVVITTHNRASLLEKTLEQLRHQQYEAGDEVVVVDNASRDRTTEVISRAADGFPVTIQQVREMAPGKSPALNAGLAVARGEIVALTDDDVLVAVDWVSTIRRLFSDSSLALVGGRVDPLWERPAPAWLIIEQQGVYGDMASPLALLHYGGPQALGLRTAVGANMAFRRTVLEAVGGFLPHLGRRNGTLLCGEDHEFCQRVIAGGYRCEYRPELRVRHWVPAERTQLRYHLRWFFWSGVTNARLDAAADFSRPAARRAVVLRHFLRRLLTAPLSAVRHVTSGRAGEAAAAAADAAFALGYLTERIRGRKAESQSSRDVQEPPVSNRQIAGRRAAAQPADIPGPGTSATAAGESQYVEPTK